MGIPIIAFNIGANSESILNGFDFLQNDLNLQSFSSKVIDCIDVNLKLNS